MTNELYETKTRINTFKCIHIKVMQVVIVSLHDIIIIRIVSREKKVIKKLINQIIKYSDL